MGFFQDLKEDLSQAVNELMPDEGKSTAVDHEENQLDSSAEMAITSEELDGLLGIKSNKADKYGKEKKPFFGSNQKEEYILDTETSETETSLEETTVEEMSVEETDAIAEEALELEEVNMESYEEVALEHESDNSMETEQNIQEETASLAEAESLEEMMIEQEIFESDVVLFEQKMAEENRLEEEVGRAMEGTILKRTSGVEVDETATITSGMTITGDISSMGSMEVLGNIIGNIDILGKLNVTGSIQGNSKAAEVFADSANIVGEVNAEGTVKIGQSSVIIGNIIATSAVIAGAVKGDIDVRGPVILDTSAIVMGNIKSKSVQINNGAVIEGMCSQCYAEVNPLSFFDDYKKVKKK